MKYSRAALSLVTCLLIAAPLVAAAPTPKPAAQVERGRYLTLIAGCHDCHSPKAKPGAMDPDPARLLSGRPSTTSAPAKPATMGEIAVAGDLTAWHGPWGVSYTANLTPDPTTGIGKRYTEASFIKTIRTGKKPEGEDLLPPMPWQLYRNMTDEDLKSIYAYLKTLKPVVNNVKVSPVPVAKK